MTKAEFITLLATKLNASKTEAENVFSTVFEALTDLLVNQDKFMVPEFGTFSTKIREEKTGRNPSTGKEMIIPRAVVAQFKSAPKLKEKLNKGN